MASITKPTFRMTVRPTLPPAWNPVPWRTFSKLLFVHYDARTFENEILDYLGVRYAFFCSSGRSSLWLALKALSSLRQEKNEVIIPAYTCPALASAILKCGLKPVLCDVSMDDFGLDIGSLRSKVTGKTLAVVAVHLLGRPSDMAPIKEIADKECAFVIEDAAQGFGNVFPKSSQKLGTVGHVGFFSFGRGKPLGLMHGGLLVTNSKSISEAISAFYCELPDSDRIDRLSHVFNLAAFKLFSSPYLYWIPKGMPFLHLGQTRFEPEVRPQKAIYGVTGIIGDLLKYLDEEKIIRQRQSQWYSSNINGGHAVVKPECPSFPFLRYPLLMEPGSNRDKLLQALSTRGLGAARMYPCALNKLPGLKEILDDDADYPNADKLGACLLTLPLHRNVGDRHRAGIKSILNQAAKGN